jgi:hypothetical protein
MAHPYSVGKFIGGREPIESAHCGSQSWYLVGGRGEASGMPKGFPFSSATVAVFKPKEALDLRTTKTRAGSLPRDEVKHLLRIISVRESSWLSFVNMPGLPF